MRHSFFKGRRGSVLVGILVLGMVAAVTIAPKQFTTEATASKSKLQGLDNVTRSYNPELPNYDIRTDKTSSSVLAVYRQGMNLSDVKLKAARQELLNGEVELTRSIPNLKVEYSPDLGAPEVIGAEAVSGICLTGPTVPAGQKHADVLRDFLRQNNSLIGLSDAQVSQLKLTADYTNPDGNLSFVHFDQEINGIPVFRGEVKADGLFASLTTLLLVSTTIIFLLALVGLKMR